MPAEDRDDTLRIDKLLWYLRFARSRNIAQQLCARGHVRLNGRRVTNAHVPVRCEDILTIPLARGVRTVRINALPDRRGSAEAVKLYYELLDRDDLLPIKNAGDGKS